MKNKLVLCACFILILTGILTAQEAAGESGETQANKMDQYVKDHESIDSIIKATYDVISGPKGEKRDWDRFRALFHRDARLIPSGKGRDGKIDARASTPDDYIKRSEPFLMQGFFEKEIARSSEIFGNIAHVFSTYEARRSLSDENPFLRGINSFQLLNDGERWWVLTIFWMAESEDNPLPDRYLKSRKNNE